VRDSFDVTQDVRSLLNVSAITTLLGADGKIFQTERITGRALFTDLVINCLGVTNEALQKGAGNVNCYVPTITSGSAKIADQNKMMVLSRAVIALIDERYTTNYQTWVTETPTIIQDTDGTYFVNIPFRYQAIQNYKNI
jgi:hypothetical protein